MRCLLLFPVLALWFPVIARNGQVSERVLEMQRQGGSFKAVVLFEQVPDQDLDRRRWSEAVTRATVVRFDPTAARGLLSDRAELISIPIPFEGGTLVLDLQEVEIAPGGLMVRCASGKEGRADGMHFRGMVRGEPGSLAALSVFGDEVMAVVNDRQGTIVLGRFDDRRDHNHLLYREHDLRKQHAFVCGTTEPQEPYHPEQLSDEAGQRTVRCVRYYWEVNHNVFLDKGSLAVTTNFATGLFNQSAALFDDDGIDVVLSELFIWDVPSPYTGPSSGNFLTQFGAYRTTFNGDLAHLIGYGGGGGVAWVNTICSGLSSLRMAYSGINAGYSNVPTYSWSVEVTTHEAGHNLGSNHTHACVWNGNATSIDGCGPTAGYTEGSCPTGPLPVGGGTIMSYCHLVGGVLINFNNGFGPQPAAVIRNAVNAAACLGVCGTTCDAPGNLNVVGLMTTTATLAWANVGADAYTLRWRVSGAEVWNTINGLSANSHPIGGLVPGTQYEFQVSSTCGAVQSDLSALRTFSTPVPCPDALEPNNSLATAAGIIEPVTVSALIATAEDADYYRITTTGIRNITLNLTGLFVDYDLRLLNNTGVPLASSTNGGAASEYINYQNAPPGTYYIHVFGYGGVFDADMCYALMVRTFVSECIRPQGLTANDITHNSAAVAWSGATPGGGGLFDLRWKQSTSSTWTEVNGIASSTHVLDALLPLTFYDVQVRRVCSGGIQGGVVSAFSDTLTFSTAAAPCEVAPPIQVNVRVWLDGPFVAHEQLMHDSLRVQGWIPLTEPYTALGFSPIGTLTTTVPVLGVSGQDAIVDWVLVELRRPTPPYAVLEVRAGLLQRDGDVVGVDGTSPVFFCAPGGEPYRMGIRHRNHLGCVTGTAIMLGALPSVVDFRTLEGYGTQPMRERSSVQLLWAGNARSDGLIRYSGEDNDRDVVLLTIGGTVPTNIFSGYRREDVNLDGRVKYSGANNDRDVILSTIGGTIPTSTVVEQMP